MKNSGLACVTLIVAAFAGCKSRTYNANESEGKAAKAGTGFTGSPAYKETRPSAFAFTDKATVAGVARLGFAPITPCDLMAWAETVHSKFDTVPEQLAKDYKAALAAGAVSVDYKEFAKPAKTPKKAVSYAAGLGLVAGYLNYTDTDAKVQYFVNDAWVQAIIDYAQGWGEGAWSGTDIKRTSGKKTDAGSAFTPEALAECRAYVIGMKSSQWGCMQHMAADYLAHVIAGGAKYTNSDADRQKWATQLATSAYADKIPFYSVVNAVPDAAGPAAVKLRRYEMPTVGYRTMKALSGYAEGAGKQKQLQDLGLKAACYFDKNKSIDSRVSATDKWKGYWLLDGGDVSPFCSFADAAEDVNFVDQATSCKDFKDLMSVEF